MNKLIAKTQNPNLQELGDEISPCFDDPRVPDCLFTPYINSASDALSRGLTFAGYGSICEGCSLVIMLFSFIIAGALCIRRFYSGAPNNSTETGRRVIKVRRQITILVALWGMTADSSLPSLEWKWSSIFRKKTILGDKSLFTARPLL